GDHFLAGYLPIVQRRKATPFGERERDFQGWRRGRYVEFNLIQDRGTKYGIESGRRIESVLASLPPEVRWRYDWHPEPGSPEARLFERCRVRRDWVDREGGAGVVARGYGRTSTRARPGVHAGARRWAEHAPRAGTPRAGAPRMTQRWPSRAKTASTF